LKGTVLKKRLLLALAATLILGGLFFWLIDLDQVMVQLRQADWRYLAAGIVGLLSGYVLMAVRWRYLLGNRLGFYQAFHANNLGNLVNSLTPIPEVAVRVFLTGRSAGISISRATSGMVVERSLEQVMRVIALLLALLTGYLISFKAGSILINTGLVLGFFLLVTWLLRRAERVVTWGQKQLSRLPWLDQQRASHIMSDLMEGLGQAGGPRQLTSGWIISLGVWGFFFTFTYLVLVGMKIHLPTEQMVAIALLTLAVAPPSAPGTPGLYQATIVGALSLVAGFNPVQMTAYAIAVHILQVIPLMVLGIWGSLSTNLNLRSVYKQRQMVPVDQDTGGGR
jgi:uncharacterized protein (TIRG00374 family)